MTNVLYVLSSRWVGDTCPIEYTESTDPAAFETELLSKGWEKIPQYEYDENNKPIRIIGHSWSFPKDQEADRRQASFGAHGTILQGVLGKDGAVSPVE